MPHFFQRFLILVITLVIVSNINVYSATQYLKLHPDSSSYTIKKFQSFFKELSVYDGKIDGRYSSISSVIIDFQVESGIISSISEEGAGYIGPKTYDFLTKKYGSKFTKAYNNTFEITEEEVGEERYFIVSAYYSPVRGQKKYTTGSYSGDIRLNGNGTHGASGIAVHPGFIAAPSDYSFGTKIYIDGLGVGTVEDRGGAIVRAGIRGYEHDRLDIWMGYGDAGLTRALNWGKKTVKGRIMPKESKNTIEYSGYIDNKTDSSSQISLAIKINPKSSSLDIKKMQGLFSKAQLYTGKVNGSYSNFKEPIIDFQVDTKILAKRTSIGNGYIGTKTIGKLEELYPEIFLINNEKIVDHTVKLMDKSNKQNQVTLNKVEKNDKAIEGTNIKNTVITSESVKNKYKITEGEKEQVHNISTLLKKSLNENYGGDNLKLKTQKNKLNKKIQNIIQKSEKESTREKLKYLYELLQK